MHARTTRLSILHLEDDPAEISRLNKYVKSNDLKHLISNVNHVKKLEDAVLRLKDAKYDLILMDLFLRDSQGIKTLLSIKDAAHFTPILILSSVEDEALSIESIRQGAQDYLLKKELTEPLLAKVIRYSVERQKQQNSLRTLSFTDELTGLYNRRGFLTLFEQHLHLIERLNQGFYLFFIDLDQLKEINDTFGHHEGDLALKEAANCLKNAFRYSDIVGRIGGDEFAILAINVPPSKGEMLKHHIEEMLKTYNQHRKHTYEIHLSVGMSYCDPQLIPPIEELLEKADQDLYANKKSKVRHGF